MPAEETLGVVHHDPQSSRRTDYLYRVSLKCIVRNDKGEALVVKETGRDWWDLPGGGMDHGEGVKAGIAREMREEVGMTSDFVFRIISVEEPALLDAHSFWQIRLIFEVKPTDMFFRAADDGDEVAFMAPAQFKDSAVKPERKIFEYCNLL